MSAASNGRRRPMSLSAQTKWEIFLQITAGEISQAEATRKWCECRLTGGHVVRERRELARTVAQYRRRVSRGAL